MSDFEKKFGRYAVPNLSLILVALYAVGYVIEMFFPSLAYYMTLNPWAVVHGQIWRIFTWLLIPPPSSNMLFTVIMLFFYYSIGTSLERVWGDYKYNVFIFRGILLTLAVFRPLGQLPLELPDWKEYQTAAEAAAAEGISQAQEAKRQRISDDLAAYILTKAAALGLEPEVEVILGEDDCPARIILTAAASPVVRQSLTGTVVRELGLEKEKVTWIDPYQSSG